MINNTPLLQIRSPNCINTFRYKKMVIIGIDLGTTNTCFGYIQDGHLKLIDNEEGNFQTPSAVTFTDENEILVGTPALMSAHEYTSEFLYEIKRLIGQSMNNPKVQEDLKRVTYKVEDDFESPKIIIKNATWDLSLYPEEISGHIIKKILKISEVRLEESISEAVITVPAYFGDDQRTATKNAASLAGLKKVHIINEPTAAALAFQHSKKMDINRNILVYDFGGGTFDVSIVQTRGYYCKVLAIDGDCHLGGTDIEMNLVDFMLKDMFERYGEAIKSSEKDRLRRLKTIAEKTKRVLSSRYKYSVDIPRITENIDYELIITRPKFEEINQEIFEKTLKIVKRCLKMSGLKKDQINEVVLVGGSTRIPKIRNMMQEYFGADKVNLSRNPDEMVAYGAAVYADSLSRNKRETFTIQDVLSLSLGTDVIDKETEMIMSIIIKRNTQIPCERSKKYVTVYDNQTEMDIRIYQGEESDANKNILLGDFAITNLKRAPKGKVSVEIKLSVDAEGILSITAKELNTDNEESLNIDLKNQRRRKNKTDIFKTVRDQGKSGL